MLTDAMDIFNHEPHTELLSGREPNEAFCLAIPEKEYVILFLHGGEVGLEAPAANYQIRWLDIMNSSWSDWITAEELSTIAAPDTGYFAAQITKERRQ